MQLPPQDAVDVFLRVRVDTPPPQDRLQEVQAVQLLTLQFTAEQLRRRRLHQAYEGVKTAEIAASARIRAPQRIMRGIQTYFFKRDFCERRSYSERHAPVNVLTITSRSESSSMDISS